jgi:MFS family permease
MDYKELNVLIFGLIFAAILGVITSIVGTISLEILRKHNISAMWLIVVLSILLGFIWKKFGKRLEFPNPKESRRIVEVDMLKFAESILSIGRNQKFFDIWTYYSFDMNPKQDLKKVESLKFDFIKVAPAVITFSLIYYIPKKIFGLAEPSVFYTINIIISLAVACVVFLQMVRIVHNGAYLKRAFASHVKVRLDINSGKLYDPDVLYLVFDFGDNEISINYYKEKREREALQLIEDVQGQFLRDLTE